MDYVKTVLNKAVCIDDIVTIHYFEYAKDFTFSGEAHDFWEIVYTDKEELVITADKDELILPAGHFYILKPMEFHTLRCNGKKAANSVIISFSSKTETLFNISGKILKCPDKCKKYLALIISEAKNAFSGSLGTVDAHMLERSENALFGSEQLIQMNLEELFIKLIREYDVKIHANEVIVREEISSRRLNEVCKYIEENIGNRLTFSDICEHFSMSGSSMKKLFKKEAGGGAMRFYNNCKFDRAKHLIREGEHNFTEISEMLAYNSVQYFSRQFKEITGMTPSQYEVSVKNM